MEFEFETDRLFIRTLNGSWAKEVTEFYLKNTKRFSKYEGAYPDNFFTAEYQEQMLDGNIQMFLRLSAARYFMFLKSNPDVIIGCLGFSSIKPGNDKTVTVFYKQDEDYCGKGYMTEAMYGLMEMAYKTLGIRRFEADIMPCNEESKKMIKAMGYEYEGLAKKAHLVGNHYEDHERYAYIVEP